jgi:hypothetical protein
MLAISLTRWCFYFTSTFAEIPADRKPPIKGVRFLSEFLIKKGAPNEFEYYLKTPS